MTLIGINHTVYSAAHPAVPDGWHRVDYIAGNSSRTAYINTGIFPTNSTKVEVVATLSPNAANGWLFATEDYFHNIISLETSGPCFSIGWEGRLTYGGGYTQYEQRKCNFKLGTPVNITLCAGVMRVNGEVCYDRSLSRVENCSWIALLANNRTTSGVIEKANGDYKVHSFKAYEQDQLVCEMVPIADENNAGAMYDLATQQVLCNAGSGQFEVGPAL